MTDPSQYYAVLEELRTRGATIRCNELANMLTSLGFDVRDGKKAGHKVFTHPGIGSFTTGAYTCGHGRNPEIKPAYIKKVARLLNQYKKELIEHLGET